VYKKQEGRKAERLYNTKNKKTTTDCPEVKESKAGGSGG